MFTGGVSPGSTNDISETSEINKNDEQSSNLRIYTMTFNYSFAALVLAMTTVSFGYADSPADRQIVGYVKAPLVSVQTRPLCPAGMMCTAGGTIATLEFEIPCAGGLVEPVTHFVVTGDRFTATVYVLGNWNADL
jgi:hypothetical protein